MISKQVAIDKIQVMIKNREHCEHDLKHHNKLMQDAYSEVLKIIEDIETYENPYPTIEFPEFKERTPTKYAYSLISAHGQNFYDHVRIALQEGWAPCLGNPTLEPSKEHGFYAQWFFKEIKEEK